MTKCNDTPDEKPAASGKRVPVTPQTFQQRLSNKRGIERKASEDNGRGVEPELETCPNSELASALAEMVGDPWKALNANATAHTEPLDSTGCFSPASHTQRFKRRLADVIEKQRRTKRPPAPEPKAADAERKRIGQNISKYMADCRLNAEKLARKLGIDAKEVREHIHGKHRPNPDTLDLYAQCFSKELKKPIKPSDLLIS